MKNHGKRRRPQSDFQKFEGPEDQSPGKADRVNGADFLAAIAAYALFVINSNDPVFFKLHGIRRAD